MNTEERLAASVAPGIALRSIAIFGHRLRYAVYGNGEPLLLLHGATFGWGSWFKNIAALGKHFTVYALDLPGAGRSSPIQYSKFDPGEFVAVVVAFIRALGFSSMSVAGHSFGAWVALHAARRMPVKKLVLVDPVGFSAAASVSDWLISHYPLAQLLSKTALNPPAGVPR